MFLFLCCVFDSSRQFLFEKLESTEEKIIVFAHHTTMLDNIEEEARFKVVVTFQIPHHNVKTLIRRFI